MGRSRTDLSAILHEFCPNVYFQPPTGTSLQYPCIIYKLDDIEVKHADNAPYSIHSRYFVQYITRDPDDVTRYELVKLPMCKFDRYFPADNLNHYNYTIYY